MGRRGPKPTCDCGECANCRKRAAHYHLPTGAFRASRLSIPASQPTLAYIAGIIDGEGSIHVTGGNWRLVVSMTDESLIRWLGEIGGSVLKRPSKFEQHKDAFAWTVAAQIEVREILVAIRPWLRVKLERADEALADIAARVSADHDGTMASFWNRGRTS